MEFFLTLPFILFAYQAICFRKLKTSLKKSQEKAQQAAQKQEKLLHSIHFSLQYGKKPFPLPASLLNLPLAEKNVLLSVKEVKIPSLFPYNPALSQEGSGYRLFFRYDTEAKTSLEAPYHSHIGSIILDHRFIPKEPHFTKIETGSLFSEDARFFSDDKNNFLIYNDQLASKRTMQMALLNEEKTKVTSITSLPSFTKMEKNWTPFLQEGNLHFLYNIRLSQVFDLNTNQLQLPLQNPPLKWISQWGHLRGGTPAIFIDGEYLSFFHSSFEDTKGVLWYVMGAYTFKSSSPFSLTRISPHPILFEGIYETPHQPLAHPKVRVIYPVGLVQSGDQLHVSCGENDSGIKILSFNTKALLQSLDQLCSEKNL